MIFAGLSAVPGRCAGPATARAVLAETSGRQHVGTHHGAISDLAALQIAGVVQIWECAGRLLGESRQAGELAEHSLLALVQQLGLPAQLLLPPRELLLGPLIDCGGLLLGGGDPRFGLLSGRALALLGLGESLRANPRSLGQICLEPLGRLAVMLGCLGQQGSGLLLRIVIGGLELQRPPAPVRLASLDRASAASRSTVRRRFSVSR